MRSALCAAVLLLAACARGTTRDAEAPPPPPPERAAPVDAAITPKGSQTMTMDIAYDQLPDDAWRKAGEVVMAKWHDALAARSAKASVEPLRGPDGAIAPYVIVVTTYKADGARDFLGAAVVWNGELLNKGGAAAATRWLKAQGFPAKPIAIEHLVQALATTTAIPAGWLRAPVPHGWDAVTAPDVVTGEPPAKLEYGKGTALLTLLRAGPATGDGGGGYTPPAMERLEVRFKADGSFTQDAARRASGGTWEPFTP